MGLFNTILTKLGLKKEEKPAAPVAAAVKPAAPVAKVVAPAPAKPATAVAKPANFGREEDMADARPAPVAKPAEPVVAAISEVDVVANLEKMASGSQLNWKVSIVDLLKILGIDSSLDARKELAKELNCPADQMGGDNSKMNIWLHKEVLRQIAQNGGNIPKDLLD